jgi:hypothetical protein
VAAVFFGRLVHDDADCVYILRGEKDEEGIFVRLVEYFHHAVASQGAPMLHLKRTGASSAGRFARVRLCAAVAIAHAPSLPAERPLATCRQVLSFASVRIASL